jgi:hypothetical protein
MRTHPQPLAAVLPLTRAVWRVEVLAAASTATAFHRTLNWQVRVLAVEHGELPPSANPSTPIACSYSEGLPHRRRGPEGDVGVSPLTNGSGHEGLLAVGDQCLLLVAAVTADRPADGSADGSATGPVPVLRVEPLSNLAAVHAAFGKPLRSQEP